MLLFFLLSCSTPKVTYKESLPEKEMRYCLIGDSGNASPAQYAIAKALQNENCDRIFVLGDVIYRDGIKNQNDPDLQKKFIQVYEGLNKNFTLVMGNHDYNGSIKSWKKVSEKYPWVFFPNNYFLQKINDVCFLVLDSNLYSRPWLLTAAFRQMKWINSVKEDLENCRFRIALAHHPYLSSSRSAEGFLKYFYEDKIIGKMNMLVTGHDHILQDMGQVEGTQLLISGAGGQFDDRPGYLIIRVSDKLYYQFKEVTE